ncbi:hypothetical protein COR50_03145 [Chitinophaga caeni]|uniref:Glycosyl transferase family 1 domain-containing protein n=1 Tax=Chitinophaga caeni TaxID=2029983 RepID=A0A291QQQ3_9BACT|nr:glycosyltransferase family 4 protein [Chitinophaga caeni]ATL46245.1 hypothetical protein COR50_03145 [Chitinophaga caeni]
MKEIAFIIFSDLNPANGGVETWLRLFLREVRNNPKYKSSHISIYYCDRGNETQSEFIHGCIPGQINYIPIRNGGNKGLFANFITLYQFHSAVLKRIRQAGIPIVVSLGSYPTGIIVWMLLFLMNYRRKCNHVVWLRTTLSMHIRNYRIRSLFPLISIFEAKALLNASLVISNGWDTQSNYKKEYRIDSKVIPNAIDLSRYEYIPELPTKKPDKIQIAFIGRFFSAKGCDNFVNAIKIFNNKYIDLVDKVDFLFVGWGEDRIEKFASKTVNCTLLGRISNDLMPKVLENAHVGLVLTKANNSDAGGSGVSNSLLELMASGKIIVAYDNIIYKQFPRSDCMLYIEENNDVALANTFYEIFFDWDKARLLAKNAREYAREFSIEKHVKLAMETITMLEDKGIK